MKTFSFAEITAQDIRHAIGSIEGIPSPVVEADPVPDRAHDRPRRPGSGGKRR